MPCRIEPRLALEEQEHAQDQGRRHHVERAGNEERQGFAVPAIANPDGAREEHDEKCRGRDVVHGFRGEDFERLRIERDAGQERGRLRKVVDGMVMFGKQLVAFGKTVGHMPGMIRYFAIP